MSISVEGRDYQHGDHTWKWNAESPCDEYLTPHTFDSHWRLSTVEGRVVRIFPPQTPEWRDSNDKSRLCWYVTVHQTETGMPFEEHSLHKQNKFEAVLELAHSVLEEG